MKKLSFESNGITVSLQYDTDVTEQDKSEVLLLIQNLLKVNKVEDESEEIAPLDEILGVEDIKVSKTRISIPTHKINNRILYLIQKAQTKCSPDFTSPAKVPVTMADVPPNMLKPHSAKRPNKLYQKAYGSLYYQEERRRGYK